MLERYMQAMKTLRKIIFLLIVGVGLFALFIKILSLKKNSFFDDLNESGNFSTQPDSIRDKNALSLLVHEISSLTNLEANYIGFEGRKSTQPDYSVLLEKRATVNQLVELTDHGSPLVRLMAFQALRNKNYPDLKQLFERHLYDDQTYNFYSGCVVGPMPVNVDFYRCIYPTLSSVDAKSYQKKLIAKYKGTMYEYMFRYP